MLREGKLESGWYVQEKIFRSDIRHDRKWWYFRSSDNTSPALFRFHQILDPDEHIYHGPNDACLHSANHTYLLPQVGRNVLRFFINS
ncbi:hypothetical protein HAX54_027480 [Datura stramonium]|uniref:Uncharacterized protein n=1 Tax=Datura stramonium TaxID=4076 RepID=A0ABS8V2M7_DATST|nr:hypothetical protein [Datura stramonium]